MKKGLAIFGVIKHFLQVDMAEWQPNPQELQQLVLLLQKSMSHSTAVQEEVLKVLTFFFFLNLIFVFKFKFFMLATSRIFKYPGL